MEQYVIKGGVPLSGEVEIGGAKNAALAILAAAIMTDETVTIDNLPDVRDINVLLDAIAGGVHQPFEQVFVDAYGRLPFVHDDPEMFVELLRTVTHRLDVIERVLQFVYIFFCHS